MVATEEKQKYSLLFSVCGKCSSEGEVRGWCGDTESFRLVGKKDSTELLLKFKDK